MAIVIIGILSVPIARYISVFLKGLVSTSAQSRGEDLILQARVDLERDFKDMNEVVLGDSVLLQFYVDSNRLPTYDPNGDNDGDTIINRLDPDDDGDGLSVLSLARDLRNIPAAGWRAGLDNDDDDDNNDTQRDVLCEYSWTPGGREIRRRFRFNGGAWTHYETVLPNVTNLNFSYFGSISQEGLPTGADSDGNGMLDQNELESLDEVADGLPLNTYGERRWVTLIRIELTVQPNPAVPQTIPMRIEIAPILMPYKRKFP